MNELMNLRIKEKRISCYLDIIFTNCVVLIIMEIENIDDFGY